MKLRRKNIWYIAGTVLMLAIGGFILLIFSLLSRTDKNDLFLRDSIDERFGWSYELLTDGHRRTYEPEFAEDGYTMTMPEGCEAVRITRTMTEDIPDAELECISYLDAVEIFLDGKLLYSDFPDARRDDSGFLHPTRAEWDQLLREQGSTAHQIRMTLPENYRNRRLTVTTYFPENGDISSPEFPSLGNQDSIIADLIVFSVKYNAIMTLYAILALFMAVVFLLDVSNDGADSRILLLCLYFLLLFLHEAYLSFAGYYSILTSRLNLHFLLELYLAPLYLYLALRLTKWWKYPLCCGVMIWTLYVGVQEFLNFRQGIEGSAETIGPGVLVLFLAVTAASCVDGFAQNRNRRWDKKLPIVYGAVVTTVAVVCIVNKIRAWGSIQSYLHDGIWTAISMGNYEPVVSLIANITAYTSLFAVAISVIRRTVQTRRTIDVLREREQQSMENYRHLLAAQKATNALRHEMRHHFQALAGILNSGDMQRAVNYVSAITGEFDQTPAGYYSQNMLVNVIAGTYLDQARSLGIQTEHRLNVPAKLSISDEDLSVLLSNMLQNALEACEKMEPAAERYIRIEMHLRGNFLFIKCVNSAPDESSAEPTEKVPGHGYGLEAMCRIARKYNSTLQTKQTPGEFSVKTYLCMT